MRHRLRTLWRKLFPVRVILAGRPVAYEVPPALDEYGQPLGMDDLLPALVKAFDTCGPMFAWLGREIARKEKLYHELAPVDPAAREAWNLKQAGLNAQLAVLNRAMRVPLLADQRIRALQKLAVEKKTTEAEIQAIRDYFDLESPEVP